MRTLPTRVTHPWIWDAFSEYFSALSSFPNGRLEIRVDFCVEREIVTKRYAHVNVGQNYLTLVPSELPCPGYFLPDDARNGFLFWQRVGG